MKLMEYLRDKNIRIIILAISIMAIMYTIIGVALNNLEDTPLPTEPLERVELIRVVDGDTLLVKDKDGVEQKVRLIGVDAPESVNPDKSKNTEEGEEASDYLKLMLNDIKYIYLEYDSEKIDKYGRTLAYVWLVHNPVVPEDIKHMINYNLIQRGIAKPMTIRPNTKYKNVFERSYNTRPIGKE